MIDKNLYKTLKERGLLYQCTNEDKLKEMLEGNAPITLYEGTDPTMNSLHIGHCVPFCILRRFQKAGHKVLLLMGGATASIGDPSGRTELRKMLSKDELNSNIEKIKQSLSIFLDFDGDNPAQIVNNADWFKDYAYIDFMREIGVHFNVNKMLSNEIYANRLKEGGLTFFELGYILMQAYDFIYLNRKYGCTMEFGGGDQWGNIVAGVELQRKLNFQNNTDIELIGATNPLLLTPEGKKMGKTEKGAIWLDKDKISAYDFYQGIFQTPDACVQMMFALFTDLDMEEVKNIIKEDIVKAKHRMAFEITKFVRGERDAMDAQVASFNLFRGGDNLENAPQYELNECEIGKITLVELVANSKLVSSKSEGRRMIEQGAVQVNNEVIKDFNYIITEFNFTENGLILKKGKKSIIQVVKG